MKMHTIIIPFVLVLLNCSCKDTKIQTDERLLGFDSYVSLFQPVELPLVWDRDAVFNLSWSVYDWDIRKYRTDTYISIPDSLIEFIPREVRDDEEDFHYRAINRLPNHDGIESLIIAKDLMEGENRKMLYLYLVNYDLQGVILSHALVSGYNIDFWESYMTFHNNESILITQNNFLPSPNTENYPLSYQTQTINECIIEVNGTIICNKLKSITGYFDYDISGERIKGYRFVTQ